MRTETKNRKSVLLNSYWNQMFYKEFIGVEVEIVEEIGECGCGSTNINHHKRGCPSLYLKIKLPTEEIRTIGRGNIRSPFSPFYLVEKYIEKIANSTVMAKKRRE